MTDTQPRSASPRDQIGRRWRPVLMAYFLRRVRDRSEAEDLTHDVLVRLLNSPEAAHAPDGYIFQMAANLLTDRARRARVRADYRDMVGAMAERDLEPLDPHRIASGRAEIADFMAALADLPQRQRTMFILYRLEGMSQDMIGAAFGISKSAVKKQIAGAMAFLMGRMRGRR